MNKSERNQEFKKDGGKLRLELIPGECYQSLGKILTFGAEKYGDNCWQRVEPIRYVGALLRHLMQYLKDENSIDKESGFLHIEHVLCNAMFLSYFATHKKKKRTRQEAFEALFNTELEKDSNGVLSISPCKLNRKMKCGLEDCRDCRKRYWLKEVAEDE